MYSISNYSICAACVIFFGYVTQTSIIQYIFYYKSSNTKWKTQSSRTEHVGEFYWFPILSNKPNRGYMHGPIALLNLVIASVVAAITAECSVQRINYMQFDELTSISAYTLLFQLILAVVYENVTEYYWHRLMHTKLCYATFHKYHHFYKSPEPWDDMYIHPLEAFGYYCILYAPPFLFPIHYTAFFAYMAIMGVCGILDHSGIRCALPGLYNTVDHDNHHLKFEVNYAFPFPYMDMLHGTFEGEWLGYTFKPQKMR